MNPSMLFRYSDSRLDFETTDEPDKTLDINFWTTNGKTQGVVRLNAKELQGLIYHLNEQLSKMVTLHAQPQSTNQKNKK